MVGAAGLRYNATEQHLTSLDSGKHFPESWDKRCLTSSQAVGVPGRGHNADEQRPQSSDRSECFPESLDWDLE